MFTKVSVMINKVLLYFLFAFGFFIPFPIFLNSIAGNFFIKKIEDLGVMHTTTKFDNAINIGFICINLIFLHLIYSIAINKNLFLFKKNFILILISIINFLILFYYLETTLIRAFSLSVFFIFLYFTLILTSDYEKYNLNYLIYGYIAGVSILLIIFFIDKGLSGFILGGHHYKYLFGFEIYQSLTTFPSVISLWIVFLLYYILVNYNKVEIFQIILLVILISLIIAYSKRTTALSILSFSIIFYFIRNHFKNKNPSLINLLVIFIIPVTISACILYKKDFFSFESYVARIETFKFLFVSNQSMEGNQSNLDHNIVKTIDYPAVKTPDVFELSVKNEKWGGRSSYLLENIYRFGIYGYFIFIINLLFVFYGTIKALILSFHNLRTHEFCFGLTLFFNFLIENIFNSHIQTPMYFVNYLMIIILARFKI